MGSTEATIVFTGKTELHKVLRFCKTTMESETEALNRATNADVNRAETYSDTFASFRGRIPTYVVSADEVIMF